MAKGKKPAAKTGKLVAHNFLPTLSKPAHVNPSMPVVHMVDAVQSLRRRGPADARDLLFQRNQAAGVMSTMSTLSC